MDGLFDQSEILHELSNDRSSWTDVRHYPDTITLRRMIRLADFAAKYPLRWKAMRLRHYNQQMTQQQIADELGVSQAAVAEYLRPFDLSDPDDYPHELL